MQDTSVYRGFTCAWKSPITSSSPSLRCYTTDAISPSMRSGHSVAYSDNALYVFGGVNSSCIYLNDFWRYDLVTKTWSLLSSTGGPSPRAEGSLFSLVAGTLLVFGGWNGTSYFNSLHAYNIASNTWTTITPSGRIPSGRYGFAWVVSGTKFFIFFGKSSGRTPLVSSYSLTFTTGTSTYVWAGSLGNFPNAGGTASRYRCSATLITANSGNPTAYIYGGIGTNSRSFTDVYSFDTVTNIRSRVTPPVGAPIPASAGCAVFGDGTSTLYVYGGFTGSTYYNRYYSFNVTSRTWTLLNNALLSPSQRTTADRALMGFCQHGSTAYVDDGMFVSSTRTLFSETWSFNVTTYMPNTLTTKTIWLNSALTLTLAGVTFMAVSITGKASVRLTISQSARSGNILNFISFQVNS